MRICKVTQFPLKRKKFLEKCGISLNETSPNQMKLCSLCYTKHKLKLVVPGLPDILRTFPARFNIIILTYLYHTLRLSPFFHELRSSGYCPDNFLDKLWSKMFLSDSVNHESQICSPAVVWDAASLTNRRLSHPTR
jgi:hypothetical protein